jgi:hypothetical protein
MTDTTAIELVHLVEVDSDSPYDDCYFATCSCGWTGDIHHDAEWAAVDAAGHPSQAVGPADEMDRLMSGLLELQDNLADVVVWLAENWSAQLPPLGWYTNGSDSDRDQPAMRVTGYCTSDELADAAAVLGATPTDDPANDTGHTRYRRAVRDIGRVRIEVFTRLDHCEPTEPTP